MIISIIVFYPQGFKRTYEIDSSGTIKDLMALLEWSPTSRNRPRICFKGRIFSEDTTLESANIVDGSEVYIASTLIGD